MNFLTTKKNKKSVQQHGFTLVEIMVSISIFTIIMTTGIGALVTITRSYQVSRTQAAVTNSIHFAMDSMVRDIRIGNAYYADDFSPLEEFPNTYNYLDGKSYVLNFMGIPERGHLRYTFDPDSVPYLTRYQAVDGEEKEYPMLIGLETIKISKLLFRVVGSDPNDTIQPSVFVYLRGTNTVSGAEFVLQTFVSQRSLDI
jgi:prepilin-type N-terminal cleavage/methylation domain-containing protein